MTKKKKLFIALALFGDICLILTLLFAYNTLSKPSRRIILYCEKTAAGDTYTFNLSDFTKFEWEYAVIYQDPVTAKEISEELGFEYTKEPDLVSGIIFVNNNEIVYEETFKNDFESLPRFMIYPRENEKISKINKENDVLNGKRLESDKKVGYAFYPTENPT